MKKNKILKKAGILLIAVALVFSSTAAIATTSGKTNLTIPSWKIDTSITNVGLGFSGNVLWDNWFENLSHGWAAQHEPVGTPDRLDAFPADDFMFDEVTTVYRVYWGGGYWNCNLAEGPKDYHFDWNVTFFEDDGSGYHPGAIYAGPFTIPDADISKSDEVANDTLWDARWMVGYGAWLPDAVVFNADTKYWITIYGIYEKYPISFWVCHWESQGEILLHEANWKSEYWGFPDWTNTSQANGEPSGMLYALLGPDPDFEVTVSKGLGVTATIKNQGLLDTTNVTATFFATGFGLVLGRTKIVSVGDLGIGDTRTAKAIFIGFGSVIIFVKINDYWGMTGDGDTQGFLFLIFIL